jgi:hypothetical protein
MNRAAMSPPIEDGVWANALSGSEGRKTAAPAAVEIAMNSRRLKAAISSPDGGLPPQPGQLSPSASFSKFFLQTSPTLAKTLSAVSEMWN